MARTVAWRARGVARTWRGAHVAWRAHGAAWRAGRSAIRAASTRSTIETCTQESTLVSALCLGQRGCDGHTALGWMRHAPRDAVWPRSRIGCRWRFCAPTFVHRGGLDAHCTDNRLLSTRTRHDSGGPVGDRDSRHARLATGRTGARPKKEHIVSGRGSCVRYRCRVRRRGVAGRSGVRSGPPARRAARMFFKVILNY